MVAREKDFFSTWLPLDLPITLTKVKINNFIAFYGVMGTIILELLLQNDKPQAFVISELK